jgi:hypothetical protein
MMVRDPVERVLSEYYFIKKTLGLVAERVYEPESYTSRLAWEIWPPEIQEIAARDSIMEWINAPNNPAHNLMAKAVAAADLEAPVLRQSSQHSLHPSSCVNLDRRDYDTYWRQRYSGSSDVEKAINSDLDLLGVAIQTLDERFEFVGLTERFEESVSLLRSKLGMSIIGGSSVGVSDTMRSISDAVRKEMAHSSGKPVVDNVPGEIIEAIRQKNKLDVALYEHVLHGRFWNATRQVNLALIAIPGRHTPLTWQRIIDGDREGTTFDPSVLRAAA